MVNHAVMGMLKLSKGGMPQDIRSAPDGNFLPPIPPRVHEVLIQKACKKLDIPCIPSRMAMLTRPLNGRGQEPDVRPCILPTADR